MGCIYLVTNKVNGKRYIGKTMRLFDKRREEHELGYGCAKLLWRAICKYGKENFEWDVIDDNVESEEELNKLEIEEIKWFDTRNRNGMGYNQTDGGEGLMGRVYSKETLEKMSKCAKKRFKTTKSRLLHGKLIKKALSNSKVKAKINEFYSNSKVIIKKTKDAIKSWNNPIVRTKIILAIRESVNDPNIIEKRNKRMNKKCYKDKQRNITKVNWKNPIVRANRMEGQKRTQEKRVQSLKKYWANKRLLQLQKD